MLELLEVESKADQLFWVDETEYQICIERERECVRDYSNVIPSLHCTVIKTH